MAKVPSIIIGISGASGAIYGIRLLEVLKQLNAQSGKVQSENAQSEKTEGRNTYVRTHLIISNSAKLTIAAETDYSLEQVKALADEVHPIGDMAACISSGSHPNLGMIIAPCSMRTLAEIATGCTTTLISRAADVTLKERRKLLLLTRETPLNLSHIRNMETVTLMGGIIAPPVPAFYNRPQTLDDMVNHTLGRVLDLFDIPSDLVKRWEGIDVKR